MQSAIESKDESTARAPRLLLVDLSGDKAAAQAWASEQLPGAEVFEIAKNDLRSMSKRHALNRVRSLRPDVLALFTANVQAQSSRAAFILFGAASGAKQIIIGDAGGALIRRTSVIGAVMESARLLTGLAIGYGAIVPAAWFMTCTLGGLLRLLEISGNRGRSQRLSVRRLQTPDCTASDDLPAGLSSMAAASTATAAPIIHQRHRILYLLAPPIGGASGVGSPARILGGLTTHVTGFIRGAVGLGARVKLVTSIDVGLAKETVDTSFIRPSGAVSPTKALFELWNSLRFTAIALFGLARDYFANGRVDYSFIYQRYNRFNCAGAILSLISGVPLVLEYNGSEVWVSRNWDPVGQRALLARFERLNHRAADLIVTISEVEQRNLIAAGVHPSRVIANPNGVDTEQFRPDCGGRKLRKQLDIQDKTVIGFLGTFAPFHGSEILARAAIDLKDCPRCHFMFIGDGDLRPPTEAIFAAAGKSSIVTFTGKIAHKSAPIYLDACDILVSPHVAPRDGTEFFGSPTKVFEYMAMARPVIASRLGQVAETVVDGETGLLVEPGDVHQLAEAIMRLKDDEVMRCRLGAASRRRVCALYTWQRNARAVFEAIEPFTSGSDAPPAM